MGKTEINDEIVRMRKLVKQARICVIRKLTREAKTLRTKKGTEKQLEKNQKKADKLINEIHFMKKIKDDRITKFGINNKKSLQEILQSKKSKISIRIMAKIVEQKLLKNAVIQFRVTYPDYEQHLQPGQNKFAKQNNEFEEQDESEITGKREILNNNKVAESLLANELNSDDQGNDIESEMEDNDIKSETEDNNVEIETGHNNLFEKEESSEEKPDSEAESTLKIEPTIPEKIEQNESRKHLKRNRVEMTESIQEYDNNNDKNVKNTRSKEISQTDKEKEIVKVISKEATVKRFVDILQEQNPKENDSLKANDEKSSTKNKSESERTVDPFFVSGDGDAYLSLAPSKTKENNYLSLDEDDNFYNNKSKQYSNKRTFANDRFFSNVKSSEDIRERRRQEESRYNDNNFNRDKSLFKKQKNNNESSFRNTKNHTKNITMNANSNENENLHPSWAAKKKQQEIIKQGFQGKKIVFDDE